MSSKSCYPNKAPVVDNVLETLSNSIRREVINYFESGNHGESAHVEELATHISNRVPSKDGGQLKTELHHQHLPKLDTTDWLEYDCRQGDVRYLGKERAKRLIGEVHAIF